jgi:hypothetical protein
MSVQHWLAWRPNADFVVFEGSPSGHSQGQICMTPEPTKTTKMPEGDFVVFEGSPGGHFQGANVPPYGAYKNYKNSPATFRTWAEWKAAMLNRLFQEQGVTGQPGRITAATVRDGERKAERPEVSPQNEALPADPRHPGKHIDPSTGIWPASEWGYECQRGFISNARFGTGRVIPRTNRSTLRKWRKGKEQACE